MERNITKYTVLFLSLMLFSYPAKADIEPINTVVQYAVSLPGQWGKQIQDIAAAAEKVKSLALTGRDIYGKAKDGVEKIESGAKSLKEKIEDIQNDPAGVLKTFTMSFLQNTEADNPNNPEIEVERMNKVKESHNRQAGGLDNIATQKEMNKQINKAKLKNSGVLFARSLLKRKELLEEETEEPDLSTVERVQEAAKDLNLASAKRLNTILETQAYILSQKYMVEIQNYVNKDGEGDE